jgi:hypothetical protein
VGEFSSIHLSIVTIILLAYLSVPFLLYKLGKKVRDQGGYIRGYKEGQQSPKDVK